MAFGCKKASPAADHEHTLTLAPVPPWALLVSPCWALNARCWPGWQGGLPLLYPCLVSPQQVKMVPEGSQPFPQEDSPLTWSACFSSPPHRVVPNHPSVRASFLIGCFALQCVLRVQRDLQGLVGSVLQLLLQKSCAWGEGGWKGEDKALWLMLVCMLVTQFCLTL